MRELDLDNNNARNDSLLLSKRPPVFYLKINLNTDFAIECFNHWVNIVEASGSDYYIVCDKEELIERVINDKNKDKFIPTSMEAKQLLRNIVTSYWLNTGAALMTPFLHAKENGYESFWNIDADDTVMCADAFKCAEILRQVQEYADKKELDCFSLDMHGSVCERYFPYPLWTFGVCYCKSSTDYVSKLLRFSETLVRKNLKKEDLVDNNLDEIFSILGNDSQIKIGTFYIENMYFRHFDYDIHCYKKGKYLYRNVSQFTMVVCRLKKDEIENGLLIPERFVKFNFGLSEIESLAFLENNDIFNHFEGKTYNNFNFDYIAKKLKWKREKLVLFGAGKDGLSVLSLIRNYFNIEPYAFCDNSPKVIGTEIQGVKVISFEQLKALSFEEEAYVLITTSRFYNEVRNQLYLIPVEILNEIS